MKKRVLFLNPSWGGLVNKKSKRYNRAWPPLSLLICASILKEEGYECGLLDGRVERYWFNRLREIIYNYDWIIITSSPLDRWQCPEPDLFGLIDLLKFLPKERTILLGVHGSLYPRYILEETGIHCVVIGEPESVIKDAVKGKRPEDIKGIAFLKNRKFYYSGRSPLVDLSLLPVPSYELLDLKRYRYEIMGNNFCLFETSRGCPYGCSFCFKYMYGKGIRYKNIENIIEEISVAINQYGVKNGYFIDLEFTIDRARTIEICKALIEEGFSKRFKWCCQSRADNLDRELLKYMKRAGCDLLHFGIESGSDRILKEIGKGMDTKKIKRGVELAKEAGIRVACFFMFGFPGETVSDMEKTIEFSKALSPDYASFHLLTPYPTTGIYQTEIKEDKGFLSHLPEHDPYILEKIRQRAYREFYFRVPYLLCSFKRSKAVHIFSGLRLLKGFLN